MSAGDAAHRVVALPGVALNELLLARHIARQRRGPAPREDVDAELRALVGSAIAEERELGAWTIGELCVREGASLLEPLLADPHAGVRWRALWAVGRVRAAELTDPVAARLEDGCATVRHQAARTLAELGALRFAGKLIEQAWDEDRWVRRGVPYVAVSAAAALVRRAATILRERSRHRSRPAC